MTLRACHAALALAVLAAPAVACGSKSKGALDGGASDTGASSVAQVPSGPPKLVAIESTGQPHVGSTVVVARAGARLVAYVADDDDRAVHVVDLTTRAELGALSLDARPAQMIVTKDGRLLVALRDQNQVAVLAATRDAGQPLVRTGSIPTDAEPVALAITPDDALLLVATAWSAKLEGFRLDVATPPRAFELALAREPRAVMATDETTAVVSYIASSALSVADLGARPSVRAIDLGAATPLESSLRARSVREGWSLASTMGKDGRLRLLAPHVLVDTGLATTVGNRAMPTEAFDVDVVDVTPASQVARPGGATSKFGAVLGGARKAAALADGTRAGAGACLLPRGAVFNDVTGMLYVGCMGADAVVEYDARDEKENLPAAHPLRRWPVASGPIGLAMNPESQELVVWSMLDRALSFVPLAGDLPSPDAGVLAGGVAEAPAPRVALKRVNAPPFSDAAEAGRRLFYAAGDPRLSRDGRACASCHPDGRDDGLVWWTANGPRRTMMIAGQPTTGPFGWRGTAATVEQYLTQKVKAFGGTGLSATALPTLVEYVSAVPAPPLSEKRDAPDASRLRGKAVFTSSDAGCSGCHAGTDLTDHLVHDVGSVGRGDAAPDFQTPSLRFVVGTPPYFHDGRAAALRDVIRSGPARHGNARLLTDNDAAALEVYLDTL